MTTYSIETLDSAIGLMSHQDQDLRCSLDEQFSLSDDAHSIQGLKWIQHAGWRLWIPELASVERPVGPHSPYWKAGDVKIEEVLLVVTLPFSSVSGEVELRLEIQ